MRLRIFVIKTKGSQSINNARKKNMLLNIQYKLKPFTGEAVDAENHVKTANQGHKWLIATV